MNEKLKDNKKNINNNSIFMDIFSSNNGNYNVK